MKNTVAIRRPNYFAYRRRAFIRSTVCPFPNAAKAGYFLERLLNAAMAAAITVGVVVISMFVFTVF